MSEAFLNGPEYDLQDFDGKPSIVYVICSTGRSGSTLLCDLMRQTGVMGVPHEYFNLSNHGQVIIQRLNRSGAKSMSMEAYFDAIVRSRTTPNGVFGLKAHPNQFIPFVTNGFVRHYFSDLRYIYIDRRDLLAQAVSWNMASQTGKWTSEEKETKAPEFAFDGIEQAMAVISGQNSLWEHFFRLNNIQPHRITYEGLLADPNGHLENVAGFLGVEPPAQVDIHRSGIKKQASNLNQQWIEQFNALLMKL